MEESVIGLYEPINQLKAFAENIWIVDGGLIYMSAYGTKVPFSTRMLVIRLEEETSDSRKKLFLWSPIEFSEPLANEIASLGEVSYIVSPNKIHYAFIQGWKKYFPKASTWASPGVRERASEQKIEVEFDYDILDTKLPWEEEIETIPFYGSSFMTEIVFFHKASKTLILADLIENFEADKVKSDIARTFCRWSCVLEPNGSTPLDLQFTFIWDKEKAKKPLQKILALKPERLTVAHGKCYEKVSMAYLERAFAWVYS